MVYNRTIMPELLRVLKTPEALVLTGMRQVGKTTLLKWLFDQVKTKNKAFFDAENPLHRKLFEEENYDNIWRNLAEFGLNKDTQTYLFIDEIQLMPSLTRVVKYFIDHYGVKFCLTGSSSFYLKNLFPESLAGRKAVLELYPLTWVEFLGFKRQVKETVNGWADKVKSKNKVSYELYCKYFDEYQQYGGFPKVVLAQEIDRKQRLLEDVFTSYFEHDVKSLSDARDLVRMRDLILLLAPRIGSRLDISKLASELQMSRDTVYAYLAFLEQTYFLRLLPRHSANADRRAAGSRKVYLCDTGLAQCLGQLSSGQVFENSVVNILWPEHELSYWSNRRGSEIDLVVDGQIGLEVKLAAGRADEAKLARRAQAARLEEWYVVSYKYSGGKKVILAQDL